MTFWLIAGAALVVGFTLAWWGSGRSKPDKRRRDLRSEMEIRDGRDHGRNTTYGPY